MSKTSPPAGRAIYGLSHLVRTQSRRRLASTNAANSDSPNCAGEYGLKVGHDGFHDPDVPRDLNGPKEFWELKPEPWKRATLVTVSAGRETSDVELELPRS